MLGEDSEPGSWVFLILALASNFLVFCQSNLYGKNNWILHLSMKISARSGGDGRTGSTVKVSACTGEPYGITYKSSAFPILPLYPNKPWKCLGILLRKKRKTEWVAERGRVGAVNWKASSKKKCPAQEGVWKLPGVPYWWQLQQTCMLQSFLLSYKKIICPNLTLLSCLYWKETLH